MKTTEAKTETRTMAYRLARELTPSEIDAIAGAGDDPPPPPPKPTGCRSVQWNQCFDMDA